jgi:hypothetical protein
VHRHRQPLGRYRLEQVIEGVHLEGAERVAVVGGHEHDIHIHAQQRQQVHPRLARELDVEEHDVRVGGLQEPRGFGHRCRFPHDVHLLGVRLLEQRPQLAPGKPLVVHDHGVAPHC